jgi:2-polyprenyl-6-methoxyphenol hydroxylase-like FAD-dependent oxidoreductase
MTPLRILIAGAGIAGLALKHALAALGVEAEVIEQAPAARITGTGLYLPANAVRALGDLGLSGALAERAGPVRRQEIRDHRGRLLTGLEVSAIWGDVGDCLAIRRADLHDILHRAVGATKVRFGTAIRAARPDGTVTFADGSTAEYDVVIGADGVDSAIRHSVFPQSRPAFLGQICWRFVAPSTAPPAQTWTAMLGDRGRSVLTLPLGDGDVYCFAAINSTDPQPPAGDWRALFADFAAPGADLLRQGGDAYFAALHEIRGDAWVDGQVVLVGDAAHAFSPSMAQGGAMALEDALVLARLLSGVRSRESVPEVLDQYRQRRAGRVRFVLEQNRRRDSARALPGFVRNAVFRALGPRIIRSNHEGLLSPP